jgi:hypothetical protein
LQNTRGWSPVFG